MLSGCQVWNPETGRVYVEAGVLNLKRKKKKPVWGLSHVARCGGEEASI